MLGGGFWGVIFTMLVLIGLYLVLVNSGGAAKVAAALESVAVNETKALQGR